MHIGDIRSYCKDMALWRSAEFECIDSFCELARHVNYGPDQTREAFSWFAQGWTCGEYHRLSYASRKLLRRLADRVFGKHGVKRRG